VLTLTLQSTGHSHIAGELGTASRVSANSTDVVLHIKQQVYLQ